MACINYFDEMSSLMPAPGVPTPVQVGALMARCETEIAGK